LPLEVRQKFDHSFSKFFTSIGTPEFEAAFSQFNVDNSGVNLNNSDVNANESEVKMNVEKPTE
jgi:hypothetical protein